MIIILDHPSWKKLFFIVPIKSQLLPLILCLKPRGGGRGHNSLSSGEGMGGYMGT